LTNTYETRSYVDAQNGFGAKIRTPFVAYVDKDGNLKGLFFNEDVRQINEFLDKLEANEKR
jgi:hypothetical protein